MKGNNNEENIEIEGKENEGRRGKRGKLIQHKIGKLEKEGIRKENVHLEEEKEKSGKKEIRKEDKKEKEKEDLKFVRGKIKKFEDKIVKEGTVERKILTVKRGRKKGSERGILTGEQNIRKFMLAERKVPTPKRKLEEGVQKEEYQEGSERKRRRLREEEKENEGIKGGIVKKLLDIFELGNGEKEENETSVYREEIKEKEECPSNTRRNTSNRQECMVKSTPVKERNFYP